MHLIVQSGSFHTERVGGIISDYHSEVGMLQGMIYYCEKCRISKTWSRNVKVRVKMT